MAQTQPKPRYAASRDRASHKGPQFVSTLSAAARTDLYTRRDRAAQPTTPTPRPTLDATSRTFRKRYALKGRADRRTDTTRERSYAHDKLTIIADAVARCEHI